MALVANRASISGKLFDSANYLFLALFALSIAYPFWTLILQSFSSIDAVNSMRLKIWLDSWHLESWGFVLQDGTIGLAYFNTIFRTVVGTALSLLVTFSAGYALSKTLLPGRAVLTFLFVFTLFFQGGLVPTYLVVRRLDLINTRLVLILLPAMSAFYIIICRNFLMTIDDSLEESAVIDGAGYWRVLFQIIIPLSKPVLATIALFAAVYHWNDFFLPLIYVHDDEKRVLQELIRDLMMDLSLLQTDEFIAELTEELRQSEHFRELMRIPPQAAQAATVLLTIGPIIFVYPFLQKYFVKGVMLGSLKG